ncbi:hypothetical protein CSUI_006685 [Cystoisospora suis]|uniref:Transmembrane protein n=1 Tax=Cystoisospora suis TaxID=483139 RepID=A0A2C6KTM5_9APIC|nr:hypothetical protein CSUI_006685 [Cystoisospora suis]
MGRGTGFSKMSKQTSSVLLLHRGESNKEEKSCPVAIDRDKGILYGGAVKRSSLHETSWFCLVAGLLCQQFPSTCSLFSRHILTVNRESPVCVTHLSCEGPARAVVALPADSVFSCPSLASPCASTRASSVPSPCSCPTSRPSTYCPCRALLAKLSSAIRFSPFSPVPRSTGGKVCISFCPLRVLLLFLLLFALLPLSPLLLLLPRSSRRSTPNLASFVSAFHMGSAASGFSRCAKTQRRPKARLCRFSFLVFHLAILSLLPRPASGVSVHRNSTKLFGQSHRRAILDKTSAPVLGSSPSLSFSSVPLSFLTSPRSASACASGSSSPSSLRPHFCSFILRPVWTRAVGASASCRRPLVQIVTRNARRRVGMGDCGDRTLGWSPTAHYPKSDPSRLAGCSLGSRGVSYLPPCSSLKAGSAVSPILPHRTRGSSSFSRRFKTQCTPHSFPLSRRPSLCLPDSFLRLHASQSDHDLLEPETEGEVLHRSAGLEMWGEMAPPVPLSALSSPVSAHSCMKSPLRVASGVLRKEAKHRSPAFNDAAEELVSGALVGRRVFVAQLPSPERDLFFQQMDASFYPGWEEGQFLHSSEGGRGLSQSPHFSDVSCMGNLSFSTRFCSSHELERFRNRLTFLSLPLDTFLFYLVVSPSDGLLFLQDGGPYLLLQHLQARKFLPGEGPTSEGSLSPSTPSIDIYDLRYAHHCLKQKVAQAAMRLQGQLEYQLVQKETERAMKEETRSRKLGRYLSREEERYFTDDDEGNRDTLESAGGVREFYQMACRQVDEFFAGLYARVPKRRSLTRVEDYRAGDASRSEEEDGGKTRRQGGKNEVRETNAKCTATKNEEGRRGERSHVEDNRRAKSFHHATMELRKIWEDYRKALFTEEEVPPFDRLEVVWIDGAAPLVDVREAEATKDNPSNKQTTEDPPNRVTASLKERNFLSQSENSHETQPETGGDPTSGSYRTKEASSDAGVDQRLPARTRRYLLRLPSLEFHAALAEEENNEGSAPSAQEIVRRWAVLRAMVRVYELLAPDAFTLAGGTDLAALRTVLRKNAKRKFEAMISAAGTTVDGEAVQEDDGALASCSVPAEIVTSAPLRRKRMHILRMIEEQEGRSQKKRGKPESDQAELGSGRSAHSSDLLFPFEWIEGPWLDSVVATAQQKRVLGSWLSGAARRLSDSSDLFEHLLRSQTALSTSEALHFVARFLRRYPRRPALSDVQATTDYREAEAHRRDMEEDLEERHGLSQDRTRTEARRTRESKQTGETRAAMRRGSTSMTRHDEEDGEGIFPVQQRALAGALLFGGLDKAAGVIEPIGSRLHAQIMTVGRQLKHLRTAEGRKHFMDLYREEEEKREQERRRRRRERGEEEQTPSERADELLLKAEEARGGHGFLEQQQKILTEQLEDQQAQQAALLNSVERQLIGGTYLFLDEAVRLLRPSETSAAFDVGKLSEAYGKQPSPAAVQTSPEKDKCGPAPPFQPQPLLDSGRVLQTFVEAQLFIFDVFRSLRVVLHQQTEESARAKEEVDGALRGSPRQKYFTKELLHGQQPEPLDSKYQTGVEYPRVEFPSLAELCGQLEGPSSGNTIGSDIDTERQDSFLSPLDSKRASSCPAPSLPNYCVLDASKVPAVAMSLVRFYQDKIFDNMLPGSIQLRITSHLHGLSASAALPVLRPRVHPLAIPVPAVSVALGESGGRPWKVDWFLYIHEAIKDPVLLGRRSQAGTQAEDVGCYSILTALFDIWKKTALPPRLPIASEQRAPRINWTGSCGSSSPRCSLAPGDSPASTSEGDSSTESVRFLSPETAFTNHSPGMAEAAAKALRSLDARQDVAARHMHAVGCCQGLRKWLWIRKVSELSSWPFYIGLHGCEMTSDTSCPNEMDQADAVAGVSPWLREHEERILLEACENETEKDLVRKVLQDSTPGVLMPVSFFGRLVTYGVDATRASILTSRLIARKPNPDSISLPHAFPSAYLPSGYDPRSKCPYSSAAEMARRLQQGIEYNATEADELSRKRGGPDDGDDDDDDCGQDTGPSTEKTLTAAEAAAAMAQAGTGETAAEEERRGMFPGLYSRWRQGKTLQKEVLHALWGDAKFEAAAGIGMAAGGPDVLSETEKAQEHQIDLWKLKAAEREMKEAAEAAFRLRLRESASKGLVHSDECINSTSFLCRLSPPVSALSTLAAGRSGGKQPVFSSLLHKETAEFLTDLVLVDHQQEHVRRMRASRAVAATEKGGDCPKVFEQLLGEALRSRTVQDERELRNAFGHEAIDDLSTGTEEEKAAAHRGRLRLQEARRKLDLGIKLDRLEGAERDETVGDLFHYFNARGFGRCLPPDTRIVFTEKLGGRPSPEDSAAPTLGEFSFDKDDFRVPPSIRLASSLTSLPLLAHTLLQQCLAAAATCYDLPSYLHLPAPPSIIPYLWQYMPPVRPLEKHFAPPPPASCFAGGSPESIPLQAKPALTRSVTPLPASFSDKPPSVASLINFAAEVPALMQQQQSMGAACRELSTPRDPIGEMKMQRKVMEKAKEAAASVAKLENQFQEYQKSDVMMRQPTTASERAHPGTGSGTSSSWKLSESRNISVDEDAEREVIRAADALLKAVSVSPAAGSIGEESGADAVLDSMKLDRMNGLQQKLTAVAAADRWPFFVEPPGASRIRDEERAQGGRNSPTPLADQQGRDWQEWLEANETLRVLKYAVIDREGMPSPSLFSDLILSGACSPSRATRIMEDAVTISTANDKVRGVGLGGSTRDD